MRILVLGTGQGGTCLLVEAVRGLGIVSFTKKIEDKKFFKHETLPQDYGTKLTTDCIARVTSENFSFFSRDLKEAMEKHIDLHIVFSLRHPLDVFMANIVRGQKPSEGGDGRMKRDIVSVSGTIEGSLIAISHAHHVYKNITFLFPERVLTIKLEDLILTPETEIKRIAEYFKVMPTEKAFEFYKYNRNRYQAERYGAKLDTSTVGLYKKWDTWHDGFFRERRSDIDFATDHLTDVINDWGYEIR